MEVIEILGFKPFLAFFGFRFRFLSKTRKQSSLNLKHSF